MEYTGFAFGIVPGMMPALASARPAEGARGERTSPPVRCRGFARQ